MVYHAPHRESRCFSNSVLILSDKKFINEDYIHGQIGLITDQLLRNGKIRKLYIPISIKTGLSNGRFRMRLKIASDENGFSDVWLINATL